MKITVLSGGSGNDKLIRGLKKLYKDADVSVIVNAYDNGKSTGVCRKLTNTLGVSDIRKNHSRMYEAMVETPDKRILEFYNGRYNFTKGKEVEEIVKLLVKWDMTQFIQVVRNFFDNPETENYEFNDFSVANIVYAQMYKDIGYVQTNNYFTTQLLGLEDFVILNSFNNTFIQAQTQSGKIIEDEGDTVFYNNPDDIIVKTIYTEPTEEFGLNRRAVETVLTSDLIVISTGTFWSSIQPTIEYLDFYKYINEAKCKKIWVMNNEEDGDSWGVTSNMFIKFMEESGLDLSDFTILENLDARESLREPNENYNIVYKAMGNIKGKHDGDKYAEAILSLYYGIDNFKDFDKILFDFDDTIWSRQHKKSVEHKSVSRENLNYINDNLADKAVIISGNTYMSVAEKLHETYGTDLKGFNVDIWADANSTLFRHGEVVDFIKDLVIDKESIERIASLSDELRIQLQAFGVEIVNIKAKPLNELERKLLVKVVNELYADTNCKAAATGLTTVDIISKNNSKKVVFDHCAYGDIKTLYIGDEIDSGNDTDIANCCNKSIKVKDVFETNVILKLLNRG